VAQASLASEKVVCFVISNEVRNLSGLRSRKEREIPRFARNDQKRVRHSFRSLLRMWGWSQ
jgi:hypothetical protein